MNLIWNKTGSVVIIINGEIKAICGVMLSGNKKRPPYKFVFELWGNEKVEYFDSFVDGEKWCQDQYDYAIKNLMPAYNVGVTIYQDKSDAFDGLFRFDRFDNFHVYNNPPSNAGVNKIYPVERSWLSDSDNSMSIVY